MFAVGDKVKYVGTRYYYKGQTATVEKRDVSTYTIVFNDGFTICVHHDWLEPVMLSIHNDGIRADNHPAITHGRVKTSLPEDSAERKTFPLMSGLMDYFPAALAAVAHHSYLGNEKHNPGQPIHWARGKSADHLDAALRHMTERDLEGAAWRILAALQMQLEAEGAPVPPGARA